MAAIELAELRQSLSRVEPAAFLVPANVLHRVVRRDRGLLFFRGRGSLLTSYVIDGKALAEHLSPEEAGYRLPGDVWPDRVILLQQPEAQAVSASKSALLRVDTWRRLFRATTQDALCRQFSTPAARAKLPERIAGVGLTEFEEVRTVLAQDGLLLPPRDDASAYAAFAAHFLELVHFAPLLLRPTFPGVANVEGTTRLVSRGLDIPEQLAATRLPGAPDPPAATLPAQESGHDEAEHEHEEPLPAEAESEGHPHPRHLYVNGTLSRGPDVPGPYRDPALAAHARTAAERGNHVRAVLLWASLAEPLAGKPDTGEIERSEARDALLILAERLRQALGLPESEVAVWAESLDPLLRRAARGFWTPEARLLYDLQRVCIDHEREVYRLEPFHWFFSLGRSPLKRPLPHLRQVSMSSHLRNAATRLPTVRLSRDDRARLESLLRPATRRAERSLKETFRAPIDQTLRATWAAPGNLPERVAYHKLIEELLGLIVRHGYLSLGDLRDAASRSDLKQPDLSGPVEFFRGGRLLAADKALAATLTGVYRRGEIYLRWLQRFSMLAFGTRTGRLFVRFVALPFGGAFVALEGLQHLLGLFIHAPSGGHLELVNRWSLLPVGGLALLAINFPSFRAGLLGGLKVYGRALKTLFVDWPSRLLSVPFVKRFFESKLARRCWRLVVKPTAVAAAAAGLCRLWGQSPAACSVAGLTTLAAAVPFFNTRKGRVFEDALADAFSNLWRDFVHDFVPGLFRLILSAFERVLEVVERVLYAVDEWLRFRAGESRLSLTAKALVTPLWGVLAYLSRIYINVLIEPQINPIKHFPVVTVSHKVMLPYAVHLTRLLAAPVVPFLGTFVGNSLAAANVFVLPGLFGFLVWEFKENWRLFEANRPGSLGAVVVGSHGETVERLLRPGLHSGTLPKAYAKLRRAWRGAAPAFGRGRPERAALKQREALHHVEESVRFFIEQELVDLLHEGPVAAEPSVVLGAVRLSTNRIRFELQRHAEHGDDLGPCVVDLEERSGSLVAGIFSTGWLDAESATHRRILDDALTGFFKKCGVSVVQTPGAPFPPGKADTTDGRPHTPSKRLDAVTLPWPQWVATWEAHQNGSTRPAVIAPGGVLPDPATSAGRPAPEGVRSPYR